MRLSTAVLLTPSILGCMGAVLAQTVPTVNRLVIPFTECPAVGADTSCSTLIVYNPDGSVSLLHDTSQGPYDGGDDTLVAVVNNTPSPIYSINLSGPNIFGFDFDGPCIYVSQVAGIPCPFGPPGGPGYEGLIADGTGSNKRGVSFSNFSTFNSGTVNFNFGNGVPSNGIPPGGSAWFGLEGALQTVAACGLVSDSSTTSPPPPLKTYALTLPVGDSCSQSSAGARSVTWGQFAQTPVPVLLAASGEKLELRCDTLNPTAQTPSYSYVLYYTATDGTRSPVGISAWPQSCNSILVTAQPSLASQNTAQCFVNTGFTSKDYNQKTPNASALFGTTIPDSTNLDWFVSTFRPNTGGLTKVVDLFDYAASYSAKGPWPKCTATSPPEVTPANSSTPVRFMIDPPVGAITNAFFQGVATFLSSMPPGVSQVSQFSPADLNRDGQRTMADFAIFQNAFGSCAGQSRYNGAADLDADGCVTFKDYQIFLQLYNAK